MPPLQGGRIIAMKVESVKGTDIFSDTYVAADVLPVNPEDMRLDPQIEEFLNRATMGYAGVMPSSIGAKFMRVGFRIPFRGAGSAYDDSPIVAPEAHRPILGCGFSGAATTTTGTEKWTYTPIALGSQTSYTIYVVQPQPAGDAQSVQLVGCCGNLRIVGAVGGPAFLEFDYLGKWQENKTITFVNGTLTESPKFPFLASAALQFGASNYAPDFSRYTLDMGNRIVRDPSGNAADGYNGAFIINREPTFTFDPIVDDETAEQWFTNLTAAQGHDFSMKFANAAQYNRGDFTFAKAQVVNQRFADRDGIAAWEITLRPTIANGANTDVVIVVD